MLTHLLPDYTFWVSFALDISAKATLLLIGVAGLMIALARLSAAVRHRVWSLTFAALLLLPLAKAALPGLPWQIVPRNWQQAFGANSAEDSRVAARPRLVSEQETNDEPVSPLPASVVKSTNTRAELLNAVATPHPATQAQTLADRDFELSGDDDAAPANTALATLQSPPPDQSRLARWLTLLWLGGAAVVLLPFVCGIGGNLRLKFLGRAIHDSEWQFVLHESRQHLGLRRNVTLVASRPDQMPMTFGWLRPYVVFPSGAVDWPAERRRVVLLHELAHVKRCDVPLQMIARLACAIYWFHPLVWWSIRRMRLDREHACDDCVLLAGEQASNYATQLLELARAHRITSPLASAALSMARPSQLEGRLLAVLDATRIRAPVTLPGSTGLAVVAVLLVTALGSLRLSLQAETANEANSIESVEAEATLRAENANTSATVAKNPGDQNVVVGTVLSPTGKPVPGANVEVLGMERNDGWPVYRPTKETIQYRTAKTDGSGRFEVAVPRDIDGQFGVTWIFVEAEGYPILQKWANRRQAHQTVELKLSEPRTVRVQLIDSIGNPVSGMVPEIWNVYVPESQLWLPDPGARALVKLWPRCSRSDEDGYTSVVLPDNLETLNFLINDERFGCQIVGSKISSSGAISMVLPPMQTISGTITAADTGKPLDGAEVVLLEQPYCRVRTSFDGRFKLTRSAIARDRSYRDESGINIYPPAASSYMFKRIDWKRSTEATTEVSTSLQPGIIVEGVVVEKSSHRPVSGAYVFFEQQQRNNEFFRDDASSGLGDTEMRYTTDVQGRFRVPVWPGPGYLNVEAASNDFLSVVLTWGEKWNGTPGLRREYYDGVLKLDLKPGEAPQPIRFELERGVTLQRKVIQPNGEPASGQAYARSYRLDKREYQDSAPEIPVENGLLRLPGFEPAHSNPVFIIDFDHRCGAAVSLNSTEIHFPDPPIQLVPCGAAKFRFVTDKGEPLANYEPRLHLIVTPGAPSTGSREENQPLWSDTIIWDNVVRPTEVPTTDSEGRVTVDDLIPGASYRVGFVSKQGNWHQDHEFNVRTGETVDVGTVVIPEHE